MGILNVTPDSFSDGGTHVDVPGALAHARRLWQEGADILDIGAESTRPGAAAVPVAEELRRLLPVLEAVRSEIPLPVSVDTRKAPVMRAAHALGAVLVNDVSALCYDPEALPTVASLGMDVCLMHMRGEPQTMQSQTGYRDLAGEVRDFLAGRVAACRAAGLPRDAIVVDPGIGFAKTDGGNLELLRHLDRLRDLGQPVLLGVSRKGFIGRVTGTPEPARRDGGSVAAMLWAHARGMADIYRVHDVGAARQALRIWDALAGTETGNMG